MGNGKLVVDPNLEPFNDVDKLGTRPFVGRKHCIGELLVTPEDIDASWVCEMIDVGGAMNANLTSAQLQTIRQCILEGALEGAKDNSQRMVTLRKVQ